MGKLSERIRDAKEVALQYKAYNEVFERGLNQLQYFDEFDEVTHQRKNAERRGIHRLLRLEEQAVREVFGEEYAELKAQIFMDKLDELTQEDVQPQAVQEERLRQQYADVSENFLYTEWLDNRRNFPSFSHFCTLTSMKAVLNLVSKHQYGQEALKAICAEHGVEREDVIRFKEREDYDPLDTDWFIANAISSIPGLWVASQAILIRYAQQVRLEGSNTPLPDNPFGEVGEVETEVRLRQAVHAYSARQGSVRDIATKYEVTRRMLEDELRDLGLLRGRGGNRKGQ